MSGGGNSRRHFMAAFAGGAGLLFPRLLPGAETAPAAAPARPAGGRAGRRGPSGGLDIRSFGAVPDGKTLSTKAIQAAVDACARSGGGVVLVPPGTFISGAIFMRSHVQLELSHGAVLKASTNFDHFPIIEGRWEGIERKTHASLITGLDLENVAITGTGTLDGSGGPWRAAHLETANLRFKLGLVAREPENPPGSPLKFARPRVVNLIRCQGALLSGFRIVDMPAWALHVLYCDDVAIDSISISGLATGRMNTVGVVIDSCKNVRVSRCYLANGDDCLSIKSGYNQDGRRVGIPSEDIIVSDCAFVDFGQSGICIGSEMSGGVRNVTVNNCVFDRIARGIFIKTARGRGGVVEDLRFSNLSLQRLEGPALEIDCGFVYTIGDVGDSSAADRLRATAVPVGEGTPVIRRISFSNITIRDAPRAARLQGLPEMPLTDIALNDVTASDVAAGIECANAERVVLDDVVVDAKAGPGVSAAKVRDLELHRVRNTRPSPGRPLVALADVRQVLVHGGRAVAGTGALVEHEARDQGEVQLAGNVLPPSVPARRLRTRPPPAPPAPAGKG